MPFKVRLGVFSKTLSHLWGKLNLLNISIYCRITAIIYSVIILLLTSIQCRILH